MHYKSIEVRLGCKENFINYGGLLPGEGQRREGEREGESGRSVLRYYTN